MKAFLMHPDQDLDPQRPLAANEQALTQDLELDTLFHAMAQGDRLLFWAAKRALLSSLDDLDTICYRQDILKDCLKNADIIREIYQIALEPVERKKKCYYSILSNYPSGTLYSAVEMLDMYMELLAKLKGIADKHAGEFASKGLTTFFAMIQRELDDEYMATVETHLEKLRFRDGVLISARLGQGNEGAGYVLCEPEDRPNWMRRFLAPRHTTYTFYIHPSDDHGARALAEYRDRGINLVANALAQSAEHIDSFFNMLRVELAFYIGCLNLHEKLAQMGMPISFPVVAAANERKHSFRGLYDICLALTMNRAVVGNDALADGKALVMITGANQGGKSTFLRSIGLAQLMMQCGMFVPAESFCANLCGSLFTHYRRQEDATMQSGKLDEELGRMSDIVDALKPDSMILFNESFSATNEREGSEIARQIVCALLEKGIKVFFVTHLYELARSLHDQKMGNAIFLRAERQDDGERTFRVVEGEPLQTSYGEDLYHRIFDNAAIELSPQEAEQRIDR